MLALVIVGTAAAVLGRLLAAWRGAFALGAALLTLVAGVAVLFGPQLRRVVGDPMTRRGAGVTGAFSYGALYSVATITTSAGPLMLLLTVAAAVGRPAYGALLSLGYAVGRGLPFLALAAFFDHVRHWLTRVESVRRPFEVVSGLALIGGALYFVRLAATSF